MNTEVILEFAAVGGLALICFVSVVATAVRLPGTWVIVAAAAGYGWLTEWEYIGGTLIGVLIGVAVFAELLELGMSTLTARKAGASRRAAWGALIGGFVGMFIFSLPLPLIGTMFGALAGCFVGALVAEFTVKGEFVQGAKVGTFSAIGFVLGIVSKIALAMVMSAALVGYAAVASVDAIQTTDEPTVAIDPNPASLAPANAAPPPGSP